MTTKKIDIQQLRDTARRLGEGLELSTEERRTKVQTEVAQMKNERSWEQWRWRNKLRQQQEDDGS